nr:hypothetical protein [Mycoplasma capricolum]
MKLVISAMYEELEYSLKKTNAKLIIDNDIIVSISRYIIMY